MPSIELTFVQAILSELEKGRLFEIIFITVIFDSKFYANIFSQEIIKIPILQSQQNKHLNYFSTKLEKKWIEKTFDAFIRREKIQFLTNETFSHVKMLFSSEDNRVER